MLRVRITYGICIGKPALTYLPASQCIVFVVAYRTPRLQFFPAQTLLSAAA